MIDTAVLVEDLRAEQADLDAIVDQLQATEWDLITPAPGWTVRHQIAHLTYFDGVAKMALVDPERFLATERRASDSDSEAYSSGVLEPYLAMPYAELLEKWRVGRVALLDACRGASAGARLPWFGPSMSLGSMITARLMEVWAHGQDVADSIHVRRVATDRLRHVIHIGIRARPFSYAMRGLKPPEQEVRTEVYSPNGQAWVFGDRGTYDVVRGTAEDLALVLTRRRHPADTDLVAVGAGAAEWLEIGQTFAGPPGPGRRAGEFPREPPTGGEQLPTPLTERLDPRRPF
jgi:uncharacterized protein (TIGR03084 family)